MRTTGFKLGGREGTCFSTSEMVGLPCGSCAETKILILL